MLPRFRLQRVSEPERERLKDREKEGFGGVESKHSHKSFLAENQGYKHDRAAE